MTFHYIRKNNSTGTIQRVNGMGVGLALRKLEIGRTRLPLACKVEIIRFAADILNDAMKNGFVHGDIKLDNIAVMNDGSLIINGYDRPRRSSITPEGTMSLPGDIYGLGLVMLELFSGQRNIELPLEQNLHNQTVLQIFLTIDWQEWAQQPWLSTMQEYLISLLFFEPSQRPHPLDIANILKEASNITTSLGIREHMAQHGLKVSMEKESLEMAQALRSSALISPVEVMADSEGTATGFFTKDKIAEMFGQPVAEDTARRTSWTPEESTPNPSATRPLPTSSLDTYDNESSLDLVPSPSTPSKPAVSQPPPQPTWTTPVAQAAPPEPPPAHTQPAWTPTPPTTPPQKAWTPPPEAHPPPARPSWTPAPPIPQSIEQPTAPAPSREPAWQPSVQPVQEQPTPSIPPTFTSHGNPTPSRPPVQPNISIGAGASQPPPNWANTSPNTAFKANQQAFHGQQHYQGEDSGGIDKNILLGAGIGALLFMLIGGVAWALMTGDKDETEDTIQVEQIRSAPPDAFEDIEPNEEFDATEEKVVEKPKKVKKITVPPKKNTPKKKQTNTKKQTPKKTSKPKPSTARTSEVPTTVPTTVGLGEFSVTIRFNKPATLKCGDGQAKDFVNQTKMTFKTRTACRINTEDGEQGALSASKSGTIRCSLSGTRIRCK